MLQNKDVQFGRFVSLLRKDFYFQYKAFIIALGSILGIGLIVYLGMAGAGSFPAFHTGFFPNILLLLGLVATSLVFRDIHRSPQNHFSLLIPASSFEKYASRFFITTVVYIFGSLIIYFVFSTFAAGVSFAIFRSHHGIFNPFSKEIWNLIAAYLVVHSIFFFGAVYFKKGAFLKTVLTLTVVGIVISVFAALVTGTVAVVSAGSWLPLIFGNFMYVLEGAQGDLLRFGEVMGHIFRIFILFVLPPALWVLGFIRYREKEVK